MTWNSSIKSCVVTGWDNHPVTYNSPLFFEVENGMVRIGVASTSTSPRQIDLYPLNACKFISLSLGAD